MPVNSAEHITKHLLPIPENVSRAIIFADSQWSPDNKQDADDLIRDWARHDIIQILAGAVAERKRALNAWWAIDLEGLADTQRDIGKYHDDEKFAAARLEWLHLNGIDGHFHDYWCEAVDHVRGNWDAISDFANLLTSKGSLNGMEINDWHREWITEDA